MKVVFYKSCSLGDFIMSLPSIYALREIYPTAYIQYYFYQGFRLQSRPIFKEYRANHSGWSFLSSSCVDDLYDISSNSFISFLLLVVNNWCSPPDLSVVLLDEGGNIFTRIKRYVIFRILTPPWKRLYGMYWNLGRVSTQLGANRLHRVEGNARYFNQLKFLSYRLQYPPIYTDTSLPEHLCEFLRIHKLNKIVTIDPGSILDFKNWGEDNFVMLSRLILRDYKNIAIIFVGVKKFSSQSNINFVSSHTPVILSCMNDLSLVQSYNVLRQSALHICNDGGSAHLADIAGTNVISVRTAVDYKWVVEPWQNKNNSLSANTRCSPCFISSHCLQNPGGKAPCLDEISLYDVYARVQLMLSKN